MPVRSKRKKTPAGKERITASRSIAEQIEGEILAGKLQPGDRLDEVALAARYGASRTPVREALLQLAAAELIQVRPRRGAIVAAMPLLRVLQASEVMVELEALCAELCAHRMTRIERNALKNAADECETWAANWHGEKALADYFDANTAFHHTIYQGAHNEYLAELVLNLRKRLSPYRRFALRTGARLKASLREHEQIVGAILAGDADRAAEAMRGHIRLQAEVITEIESLIRPIHSRG